MIGSVGIQTSSALSSVLFDSVGPVSVASLRLALAALILLVVLRPKIRGLGRAYWISSVVHGVSMAAMNICLYSAIERIPLGIAVTLEFLGPCAVSVALSRRISEALWAIIALVGVVLVAGPGGYFDLVGFAFAAGAGSCFAIYTLFSERVGKCDSGSSGIALSASVAAVASLPFSLTEAATVSVHQWMILAITALIGVAIPYTLDIRAARASSARIIGTLFSIDPAMASVVGWLALGEIIEPYAIFGIALVIIAGAAICMADRRNDG
ncbi:EamA family transporter [Nocardia sp. NPDC049190]|uniref:EamA family transporter n=1 Tax=Nocardia sp. NPDC049190 TaxID=3155650 RepID=UPI0033EE665B